MPRDGTVSSNGVAGRHAGRVAVQEGGLLSTSGWLRCLVGEKLWAVLAWDDPLPLVVASVRFWLRLVRRSIGECFGSRGPH